MSDRDVITEDVPFMLYLNTAVFVVKVPYSGTW